MDLVNIVYKYINHFINRNELIKLLKDMDKTNFKSSELKEINKLIESLQKIIANEKNNDSGQRYDKLYNLLVNNSVYINYCKNMSDLELLKYITQYICPPMVPKISNEVFDNLVDVGIKEDKREALWRLAFNYKGTEKDVTSIADYFIEKRDADYLTELISAVQSDLNLNELVDKVMNTKDKNFIFGCGNRAMNLGIFTDEEIEKIKIRIKEEESSWK